MRIVPVGEFKAHFSDILREVMAGNPVGISYGRRKETVAVLCPPGRVTLGEKRVLGRLQDRTGFAIGPDFEMCDEDMLTA